MKLCSHSLLALRESTDVLHRPAPKWGAFLSLGGLLQKLKNKNKNAEKKTP